MEHIYYPEAEAWLKRKRLRLRPKTPPHTDGAAVAEDPLEDVEARAKPRDQRLGMPRAGRSADSREGPRGGGWPGPKPAPPGREGMGWEGKGRERIAIVHS